MAKSLKSKKSSNVLFILFSIVLGFLMGWLAKDLDNVAVIGAVGTNLGIWITVATLLAVYSNKALEAAEHVLAFFVAMLAAYYTHTYFIEGFFPQKTIIAWLIFAVASGICGFIVWYANDKDWLGALCASIPIAMLFAEGYPVFYTKSVALGFDIVCAIGLFFLLARSTSKKLKTLAISVVLAVLMAYFGIYSVLFGWIG